MKTVSAETLKRQIAGVFRAWGMDEGHIATTVDLMVEADLRGIDSHGIGMLPTYELYRRDGKLNVTPDIRVVRDLPTLVLIDADHALGHVPADMAMRMAITKCHETGVAIGSVRNSNHFGAAGVYSTMALEEGLIGICVTGTTQRSVVPTFGREPMYSTNPIAFAAPTARNRPYSLDMATSTVAVGKLKIAERAEKKMPVGWVVDSEGRPETDPTAALEAKPKRLTPVGGTREFGSHKGFGMAMVVEILGSVLGGSFVGGRDLGTGEPGRYINVGHFFLALDPAFFRGEPGAFETGLDDLIDYLHDTPPIDPERPVLVAGEPEHGAREQRLAGGIPVTDRLFDEIRQVAEACGAPFVLEAA